MNKALKDGLFYFFIIAFVFGTMFLSIYASGYKFNLKLPLDFNRILIRTGMLNLNSNPRGSKIFLNGKEIASDNWRPWKKSYLTTPAKIKNLLPGSYELTIEKDGYWPFKADIMVDSGLTTFFEDISLFKADNPTIKAITDEASEEESIFLSPNSRYLYLKDSAQIINIEKDEELDLKEAFKETTNDNLGSETALWLGSNELLLNGIIFSPRLNSANQDFISLVGKDAYNWKYNSNDNKLYYQNKGSLRAISVDNKSAEIILRHDDVLSDYLVKDKSIFLILSTSNRTLVQEYSLEEKRIIKDLTLATDGDYSFKKSDYKHLSLYDKKNKSLYFIETEDIQRGYRKIDSVNDWQWLSTNEVLIINDWELKHYNIQEGQLKLLTRLGNKLEKLIVNENKKYLILLGDNKIIIYDLKTRFLTTILEAEKIKSSALDKNKDLLYFWGKLKEQQGVYRISIR